MLKVGAELIGWSQPQEGRRSRRGRSSAAIGIGVGDWGNGGGRATIGVNVYRNGTIEVLSGAQDIGMGYRTMIGDVVRTYLGLPRELLVVKVGRGDLPAGPGERRLGHQPRHGAQGVPGRRRWRATACCKLVAKEWGLDNTDGPQARRRRHQRRRQDDRLGEGLPADDRRPPVVHRPTRTASSRSSRPKARPCSLPKCWSTSRRASSA